MYISTLINLLPLLAALTTAAPVISGAIVPLAGRDNANSASVYTVDKVGHPFPVYRRVLTIQRSDADSDSESNIIDTRKRSDADSASVYTVDSKKRSDADSASVYTVDSKKRSDADSASVYTVDSKKRSDAESV